MSVGPPPTCGFLASSTHNQSDLILTAGIKAKVVLVETQAIRALKWSSEEASVVPPRNTFAASGSSEVYSLGLIVCLKSEQISFVQIFVLT